MHHQTLHSLIVINSFCVIISFYFWKPPNMAKPTISLPAYLHSSGNSLLYRCYGMIATHRDTVAANLLTDLAERTVLYLRREGHSAPSAATTDAEWATQVYEQLRTCPRADLYDVDLYRVSRIPPETKGAIRLFVRPKGNRYSFTTAVASALADMYREWVEYMGEDEKFADVYTSGPVYEARRAELAAVRKLHNIRGYDRNSPNELDDRITAARAVSPTNRLNKVDTCLAEHAQRLDTLATGLAELKDLAKAIAQHVGLIKGGQRT